MQKELWEGGARTYDDIVELPHPCPATRPRMPAADRAAQFAPFAALAGYEACIAETARRTDARPTLDENEKAALDERLHYALRPDAGPAALRFTRFVPDAKKSGGALETVTGTVRRLDACARTLILTDGTTVALDDVVAIDGEIFSGAE